MPWSGAVSGEYSPAGSEYLSAPDQTKNNLAKGVHRC
jgi:hypothetical protein